MGRDVGGQSHGNAARAVHQQIGEAGGQHIRLLQGIIEIQPEGHGVLVDVLEHEHGQRGHAGLGITHGGGAVAVHGAEVAVAVHQRAPHAEILRQTHQRVVHAAVAMGMIFTKAVAHDAGAFAVRGIRGDAQFVHGKEDAALHGLHAVLHPGDGPIHDDVLGIGDHAHMHDFFHGHGENVFFYDRGLVVFAAHERLPPSSRLSVRVVKLSSRLKSAY